MMIMIVVAVAAWTTL